ncbi:MAG: hypothetical protein PHH04_05790 [Thomasclavelia sp.]|nr:hypothetical protein [Thomasclavelia sp.]
MGNIFTEQNDKDLLRIYLYEWLISKEKECNDNNIMFTLEDDDKYGKYISYQRNNLMGLISIYNDGIVEEQITTTDTNKLLFYLHYKLVNLSQMKEMYHDFFEAMKNLEKIGKQRILICCSGGLTSSLFASNLNLLAKLLKLNYKFYATNYSHLKETYNGYAYILLAPQISYHLPRVISLVGSDKVEVIDPSIYATHDYKQVLLNIDNKINHYK